MAFPTGFNRQPLVRVCSSHGESGIYLVEHASFAVFSLPEFTVPTVESGGRNPGGEEVCTERQNELAVFQVKVGHRILSVDALHCCPVSIVVDGFES